MSCCMSLRSEDPGEVEAVDHRVNVLRSRCDRCASRRKRDIRLDLDVANLEVQHPVVRHLEVGAELSGDSHQRSRLFGVAQMTSLLGVTLAFAAMQFVANADSPRDAARLLGSFGGAAVTLLLYWPMWTW